MATVTPAPAPVHADRTIVRVAPRCYLFVRDNAPEPPAAELPLLLALHEVRPTNNVVSEGLSV